MYKWMVDVQYDTNVSYWRPKGNLQVLVIKRTGDGDVKLLILF